MPPKSHIPTENIEFCKVNAEAGGAAVVSLESY